ncbi:MAG TPA: polysaccharide biosynthesis/export family protein [Lacunisphaera sp.]|nr:polysaccharide biosynthesis/export family protein [Lacunisphaera sp.]
MKSQVDSNSVPPVAASAVGMVQRDSLGVGAPYANAGSGRRRKDPAGPAAETPQWWQLAVAARRHWLWLVVGALVGTAIGAGIGRRMWQGSYVATAQIVRYDTPDPQLFQPRTINPATLVGMVSSAEVRTRVGAKLTPARSAEAIGAVARVTPVPNTDLVNVALTAPTAELAVSQANLYAEEAVQFTREMQAHDARDAASYLRHQIAELEKESASLSARFSEIGAPAAAAAPSTFQARLETARNELLDLQTRYTDQHPLVQQQMARVEAIEKQIAASRASSANVAAAATPASAATGPGELEFLREKARTAENQRRDLVNRLQITEMLAANPLGHYRIFSPASSDRAMRNNPALKIALLAAFLGLCGLVVALVGAVTDEALDPRLRTADDIRRVTRLPVIARLGRVDAMSSEALAGWAFRTWTALQSRLSATPNRGLVCGITSSSAGEGRSVWIKLLADAASKCGFRVVILSAREASESAAGSREGRPASAAASASVRFRTGRGEPKSADAVVVEEATLSDTLLADPEEAANQIFPADSGPSIVQIPLPGWVWDLDHRKEWLASLHAWGANENAVVFVELPPASSPEAVLLAQNLPNVLWLSDTTKATALETRQQIETLRMARCNLVGAVVNRSQGQPIGDRFARWMPASAPVASPVPAMAALALAFLLAGVPHAGAALPGSFSIVSPAQRAAWQQQLTLGPGDILRIGLYGEPTATRAEIAVQPDGRINYLEARDVVANGLTVDQLRAELDRRLGEYRRSARTTVSPVAFRSKKYHMLGLVAQRGAFTLDRPMTVVEAIARARGFETSAVTGDVTELADLSHAFLIRNGERKQVDFARLFTDGDLSQNIAVEPGDYFYFPPADVQEVYVLGEVQHPGPATLAERSTSLRAVAARGGFTNKAWRDRVLVVRGSLNQPKAISVNLSDVLAGRGSDVMLEPHDIVYVSARPWWKAEDLLDEAASAFTQAFVVYWTSDKVVPVVPLQ